MKPIIGIHFLIIILHANKYITCELEINMLQYIFFYLACFLSNRKRKLEICMIIVRVNCMHPFYFLAWIGGNWSLTVMESLRIFGLSYSSILMPALKINWNFLIHFALSQHALVFSSLPRDNRRSPLEPPLDVENARWRSTPGMTTDVKSPCPLQNSKIDCATFAGASASTSPARSIFIIETLSLSVSLCNFSTTLAYGDSIPVISNTSTLQFFNGKSLRL
jgi:hypothetical protein